MTWTWRNDLRLWFYNWVKRPWNNVRWRILCATDQELKAKAKENPYLLIVNAGRMTKSDMLWAHSAFEEIKDLPHP